MYNNIDCKQLENISEETYLSIGEVVSSILSQEEIDSIEDPLLKDNIEKFINAQNILYSYIFSVNSKFDEIKDEEK